MPPYDPQAELNGTANSIIEPFHLGHGYLPFIVSFNDEATYIEKSGDYVNMSYNDEVSDNLLHIEKNGLMTTTGYVFSEYNLFTSTGRPSNRFGGINFAALNKKDGSRERFISRYSSIGNHL